MSGAFTGFSEEDIKKLKTGNTPAKIERKIIKAKRNEKSKNISSKLVQMAPVFEVPEAAKLNPKTEKNEPKKISVTEPIIESQPEIKDIEKIENTVTVDLNKIEKRVIDLDEFQARQKLMEEQNRKRKELLSKALADRTKRTEAEARKLKEIQNEFKKLDALLSNDVSILRHQIEVASLDFMEAQKRYHRIEKEFLEAKLNLHQKLERKEMLTEHLCAIIEKNEERKAEKLSELMNRLEVDGNSIENESQNEKEKVNGEELIEEIKNRREVKIDLHPKNENKNDTEET